MLHQGEPIRLMSGDHGTCVVADGDEYPEWYTLPAEPEDVPVGPPAGTLPED